MGLRPLAAVFSLGYLAACTVLPMMEELPIVLPTASALPSISPSTDRITPIQPSRDAPASVAPSPNDVTSFSQEPVAVEIRLPVKTASIPPPASSFLPIIPSPPFPGVLKSPGPDDHWQYPTPPPDARTLTVARVVDGDTLHLQSASETFGVRLIGVDTPETVHPTKGIECFGPEASAFTKTLTGQTVKFGNDPTQGEVDRYERALGYIWHEGRLLNQELIFRGLAREYTYNKPYRYQEEFKQAQSEARQRQLGIWSAACQADTTSTSSSLASIPPPSVSPSPVQSALPEPEQSCEPGEIWVNSYTRKDGTVVRGYCRRR
ncbi:MAG: thermonuclease family protein [Candidatus Sericytochromatia bacterium]|nr:thermonuclease family protein [Candidatus Sericytochromatia bacterium]